MVSYEGTWTFDVVPNEPIVDDLYSIGNVLKEKWQWLERGKGTNGYLSKVWNYLWWAIWCNNNEMTHGETIINLD